MLNQHLQGAKKNVISGILTDSSDFYANRLGHHVMLWKIYTYQSKVVKSNKAEFFSIQTDAICPLSPVQQNTDSLYVGFVNLDNFSKTFGIYGYQLFTRNEIAMLTLQLMDATVNLMVSRIGPR